MVTLQKKFIDKYQLPFTLLSDTTHDIAECYGVWQEKAMYGKKIFGIIRSAFLIDESGIIIQTWYKVKPDETVPNVLTIISQ
jgi:peroxiredoxin Q/BCP